MGGFLSGKLLEFAIPLVVGVLTPQLVDLLKKLSGWLDASNPMVKQALAIVIAGLMTGIAQIVGHDVPTDIGQWDVGTVHAFLAALLALVLKHSSQLRLAKAAADLPAIAAPITPA